MGAAPRLKRLSDPMLRIGQQLLDSVVGLVPLAVTVRGGSQLSCHCRELVQRCRQALNDLVGDHLGRWEVRCIFETLVLYVGPDIEVEPVTLG
jgi:hypothetical protein